MSELRHDPLHGRWVIIAADRGKRPTDFVYNPEPRDSRFCPFCPGNEDKTPPEVYAVREQGSPNEPGWLVRVIPNKFPALTSDGELQRRAVGIYDAIDSVGAHEVVIETPDHFAHMSEFSADQLALVLKTWRERLTALMEDERLKYAMLFKNYGSQAGATLAHPHSQIIAMPVVPVAVTQEIACAEEYFKRKERCLLQDILRQERENGERVVIDDERFTAFSPFASRFPYEALIAGREQSHCFTDTSDDDLAHLAKVLKETLARMQAVLSDPPFNLVLHNAPNLNMKPKLSGQFEAIEHHFQWYLEIIPRLTTVAGFEWGTGFFINPTLPEEAARNLREVSLS